MTKTRNRTGGQAGHAKEEAEFASQELLAHFAEARRRLWWCVLVFIAAFGLSYYFVEDIFNVLIIPLNDAMAEVGGTKRMIFTNITEGFVVYLKLAGFGAVAIGFPFFIWQAWRFAAPGLYPSERRAVRPFLVCAPLLFLAGALFVYFFILPLAWKFLLGFQSAGTILPLELEARASEYLSLVSGLMIVFGLSFQLPIVLVLLMKYGVLSVLAVEKFRRFAIVIIFIAAAFITPPDIISQIGLAVPLIALYEIAILVGKKGNKAKENDRKKEVSERL